VDLREIGLEDVDWIILAQDMGPLVGSCERGYAPAGAIKRWG
jgi:hypothetical protein